MKNTLSSHKEITTINRKLVLVCVFVLFALMLTGCQPSKTRSNTGPLIHFYYYYASNCHLCQEFLNITVPNLENRLGIRIDVIQRDVLDSHNLIEYKDKLKHMNIKPVNLPSIIIGNTVLQGKEEIDERLESELKRALENGLTEPFTEGDTAAPPPPANNENQGLAPDDNAIGAEGLAFLPVILAGLADGVNPCVFSTLIFLLVYLTYAGKTRRQILLIGIFYTVTVFCSYFLIGLGIFNILYAVTAFAVVSNILNIVLIGVLVVFAGISLYDFIMIRRGKVDSVKLQLPDFFKKRIRKTIRGQAASATIIISAVILGFLVSVFELVCTGQIYFPTIAALVQTRKHISDFLYLLVYNIGFIIPLLIVFFLTYMGLSSERLTKFFQKNMGLVKLVIAVLFFGAAVFMVFYLYGPYIFVAAVQ